MGYYFSKVKPKYYASIKEYRDECLKINSSFDGCNNLEDYEDIEKWDLNNQLFEKQDTVPSGYSIGFEYLYITSGEVVGMVNLRPRAEENIFLNKYGGHIGYSIKPSKRRLGLGTRMLKEFLPICKNEYGLNKIMISCLEDNEGSRRIILNNGGVLENKVIYPPRNKLLERYWISL